MIHGGIMKKLIFILTLSLLLVSLAWGQTNPAAHDLSSSDYSFTGFAAGTTTTYPTSMQGWKFSAEPTSTTTGDANGDRVLANNASGIASGSIRNEIADGISLLNSSSNNIGAIAVSLNTTDRKDITLGWVAADMVSTATRVNALVLQYRVGTSGNFTDVSGTTYTSSGTSQAAAQTFSSIVLPAAANGQSVVQVRWLYYYVSGSGSRDRIRLDEITISSSASGGTPTPTISVDPATLTDFGYVYGSTTSASQSYTLSGANLTGFPDNITITGSTNYEVSTDNSSFAASKTVAYSSATLADTTIYVRLKTGLAIATYNSEDISNAGGGATTVNVTCSGEVTTPPAPDVPVATAATATNDVSFAATWEAVSGATGYYLDVYTKTAGTNATDLFISEYYEGSSGVNKAIEIYNGTGSTVDLTAYSLQKQTNGAGLFGGNLALTGTLANGSVYIVAHSSSNATILNLADQTFGGSPVDFNGNDAVALYKSGVQIDVVGIVDQVAPWGENMTLVRKATINSPTTAFSFDDWNITTPEVTTNLGSHTMAGGSTKTFVTGYNNLNVGNVTSHAVSGLDPETTYYYVVRAYDAYAQTSANSDEIEVTTTEDATVPVELSSFTVALNSTNQAVLTWVTQTETGVNGFYIYRNTEGDLANALLVSSLIPATNSSQQQVYIYRDKELNGAGTYYYWLQVSDLNGSESYHGPITLVYEGENDHHIPVIPEFTELKKIFPNPFNPSATISYGLVEAAPVSIKIYNSRGQMVRSFEEGWQNAGSYNLTWNGEDNSGRSLPTGVYYIRMQAGNKSFDKKAVLMK